MIKQTLDFLNKINCKVDVITFFEPSEKLIANTNRILHLKRPSLFETGYNVLFKKMSIQEGLFYRAKNISEIVQFIVNTKLLIFDMLRTGVYRKNQSLFFEDENIKSLLEMDDRLSKRYQRLINTPLANVDPLGTYSEEMFKNKMLKYIFIKFSRLIYIIERRRIFNSELNAVTLFDKISFVSGLEATEYNKEVTKDEKSNVYSIPPLFPIIDVNKKWITKNGTWIFVGDLFSNHNRVSIIKFCEIFGHVIRDYGISINVIGRYPSNFKNSMLKYEFLVIKGFVDDLKVEYKNADLSLCYLTTGTGIKLKVLEALQHNLPIIANEISLEGIKNIPSEVCCSIESVKDLEEFCNAFYRQEKECFDIQEIEKYFNKYFSLDNNQKLMEVFYDC